MRSKLVPKPPIALACGILRDGARVLFLVRRRSDGMEMLELPCVAVHSGENTVALLSVAFREQAGIDGMVCEPVIEGRHNLGSRRRKALVPAIGFAVKAKNCTARPASGFAGFKWMALAEAARKKLSRNTEWLAACGGR